MFKEDEKTTIINEQKSKIAKLKEKLAKEELILTIMEK